MKQIVELLKLGEAGTSVEEVIEEFNQLGVRALDKELAGMVGSLREAIRAGKATRGRGGGWRTT